MLNISPNNSISDKVSTEENRAFGLVSPFKGGILLARFLLIILGIILIIMFLPWNQVIHGRGEISTVDPQNRPQNIPSVIPGKIKTWHVQEGDQVEVGDTIVQIEEVKNKFFDPELVRKTKTRIEAKQSAYDQYKNKVENLQNQIDALNSTRNLKLQQLNNKIRQTKLRVRSDSIDLVAAKTDLKVAKNQFERFQKLKEKGLKSLSELQEKRLKLQSAKAKRLSASNKLESSRNKLINLNLELTRVQTLYADKVAKAKSDLNSAKSNMHSVKATITKLQNDLVNYQTRNNQRFVTAGNEGIITKVNQTGIGEIIKEGETIVQIMPNQYKKAVELYVRPRDYPLLYKGESVRLQFDGWPAIVFSGWPNISHGTFEGKIYAIDNFISKNGRFRIMVAPPKEADWPDALRAGSGATGMIMLETVPVWYEIWRQLNGFPPNYYKPDNASKNNESQKPEKKPKKPKLNIK